MVIGSLFSGIGGFDLAFRECGAELLWAVEIDKECRRVLSHHFPETEIFEDVQEVGSHNLTAVDLICGGFPCQDLSVAGKRAGLDGKRSGLWFEFHRIIRELSPQWVFIENVPGLLSSGGGRDFAIILSGLGELGYHAAWRVLDAQYFGVPQRRRRVFIVASLGSGLCAEVLFESTCGCGDTAPRREAREEIAGTLGGGSTESRRGYRNDLDTQGAFVPVSRPVTANQGRNWNGNGDLAGNLICPITSPTLRFASDSPAAHGKVNGDDRGALVAYGGKQRSHNEKSSHGWCEEVQPPITGGQDHNMVAYGGNRTSGPIDTATACNAHGGTGRCDFESETFVVGPVACNAGPKSHDAGNFHCNQAVDAGHIIPVLAFKPGQSVESQEAKQVQWAIDGGKVLNDTAQALRSGAEHNYQFVMEGKDATENQTNPREILRVLRQTVGEKAFEEWGIGIIDSLQQTTLLQPGVHEGGVQVKAKENRSEYSEWSGRSGTVDPTWAMRVMREAWERCSPQGREPQKQFTGEQTAALPELPQQCPPEEVLQALWCSSQGLGVLRQALSKIQEIWKPADVETQSAHTATGEIGVSQMLVRRLTPT